MNSMLLRQKCGSDHLRYCSRCGAGFRGKSADRIVQYAPGWECKHCLQNWGEFEGWS